MARTETVDARGLACPLPLALARRRMAELSPGDRLVLLATDPEAPVDIAAWAAADGHGFEQQAPGELVVVKSRRHDGAAAPGISPAR